MHTLKDSPRGRLLSQYVPVRITSMNNVDIGLFDYDRHNAIFYFALSADEQIYFRYGGRDATAPDAYLNLESFERALQTGLEEHARYEAGALAKIPRPASLYPRDVPLIDEEVVRMGRCVECHLIADYQALEKEFDGTLNKLQDMFVYPDIKRIGIDLDIPTGLSVKSATGAAAEAGLRDSDIIRGINGKRVLTFGDLQHEYNKVPRDADSVSLAILRGAQPINVTINLPTEWWWTDLYHRYWTIEPQAYFYTRPLTAAERSEHGLKADGISGIVTAVDTGAKVYNLHSLQEGDIIYAVNGLEIDDFTENLEIYIKLNVEAGDDFTVMLLREGETMEMKVRTHREHFRKAKI